MNFFDQPQAAAVLKHGILSRYLRPFVTKTGSRARDRRVAYLDGYAGRGTYADGSPGSPALAMKIARLVSTLGPVDGHLVEQDTESFDELQRLVTASGLDWSVYKGDVADHLDQVLEAVGDAPLFAFLDPFGLGLPLATLEGKILSRAGHLAGGHRLGGVATEVLLNFSWSGLRRNAGHLTSESDDEQYATRTRQTFISRVNAALGGEWWHELWYSLPSGERELRITEGFLARLEEISGGWRVVSVPVSDRWQGPVDYYLILLTQHPDGRWRFHEALSSAMEEYRQYCFDQSGEIDFEPLDARVAEWIAEIKSNIAELLTHGDFIIEERMDQVYGRTLTFAREMHVRKAINQLHEDGRTDTTGVGDIQKMRILPPSQPPLF